MSNHSKYPKEAGIYKLTCNNNGKIYIGKSVNLYNRLNYHKQCSKRTKGVYHFQRAIIKYGWDSFNVEILEIVKDFDKSRDNLSLLQRESYYIELFDSTNQEKGYNICKFSTDCTGRKISEETREKMRQPRSEEHKKNLSLSRLGKSRNPFSEETKEKMRQSKLGRTLSNEHKESMRKANLGKTLSEEHKEKIKQAALERNKK